MVLTKSDTVDDEFRELVKKIFVKNKRNFLEDAEIIEVDSISKEV